MDALEKKIIEQYGTEKIQPEEIDRILNDAARDGLIERKDIRPQPAMDASSLVDHISHLRRLFLINDSFNLNSDEDPYENFCSSGGAENTQILNSALRAYFEYEKKHSRRGRGRSGMWMGLVAVVGMVALLFFSYTPKPY